MKRKVLSIFTAILLVAMLMFVSCVTPTTDSSSSQQQPPTTQPSEPPHPGVINYTDYETALGIVHRTGTVYKPTQDINIQVFSRGRVSGQNTPNTYELRYYYEFRANSPETMRTRGGVRHATVGDVIHIESDYRFITVEMLGFEPVVLYSPTGQVVFQIPSDGIAREAVVPGGGIGVGSNGVGAMGAINASPNWQRPFPDGTFGNANIRNQLDVPRPRSTPHVIRAHASTPQEISASRNLAINPFSILHVHELNVGTPVGQARQYSRAVENGSVIAFPHAFGSRIRTGTDMGSFQPRNAIDGSITSGSGYINYGSHAWDPGTLLDAEFKVYFGREVLLESINLVLRSANGDTRWNNMSLGFSDGSIQSINNIVAGSARQSFNIIPVATKYVRLMDLRRATAGSPVGLTEFEAIGTDITTNVPALKTYTMNTFNQENILPDYRRTNAFSASELTEALDLAGRDAFTVPFTRVNRQFSPATIETPHEWSQPMRANSTWVDSVLYSALLDAFTTTGTLDHYLAVRYVADSNFFMIRDNEHVRGAQTVGSIGSAHLIGGTATDGLWNGSITDFADCYLIGEVYLVMNALAPAEHKLFSTFVNADANMAISPNWNSGGHWNRGSGFSANLGAGQFNRQNPLGILDWWWCDAIYMGLTFFTNMSNVTGNFYYIERAFDSYMYWRNILANREDSNPPVYSGSQQFGIMPIEPAGHGGDIGLWHRDTDLINRRTNAEQDPPAPFTGLTWPRVPNPNGGWDVPNVDVDSRPTFWGRGNGWVFVGIAKTLLGLNENLYHEGNVERFDEIWNEYADDLAMMARTLRHYQRDDGTWNVSIIDPYWFPGRETTGTSAFIYGIAIGIQLGILDPVVYMPVIEKGLAQLLGMRHMEAVDTPQTRSIFWGGIPAGRMGYMQSVGFHAYSYLSEAHVRYRSSAFGYGLFIHALAAVLRMTYDYNPVWFRVPPDSQMGVWVAPEYRGVTGGHTVASMRN
ncbi:MAG: glycoside hydrolase family 88 protein [Firmicutes bacterium]|nr:glycoside hydrolase family 88 protein [Bacillota bacterium]